MSSEHVQEATRIRPPYSDADIDHLQDLAHDLGARLQEVIDELARRAKQIAEGIDDDEAAAASGALAQIDQALRHDDRPATG